MTTMMAQGRPARDIAREEAKMKNKLREEAEHVKGGEYLVTTLYM